MSTLCVDRPRSMEQYASAWAISFAIHGLALGLFVALVTSLRLPPDPNLFRWEVALVELSEPTSASAPAQLQPVHSAPVTPASEKTPASTRPPAPTETLETPAIVKPIERVETMQVLERARPVESVQTVQTAQSVTRRELQTVTPLPHETSTAIAQTIQESATPASLPVQTTETVVRVPATMTTNAAVGNHAISREARSTRETASVPATEEKQVVMHDQPVSDAAGSGLEQVRVETRAYVTRPSIEAKAIPAPSQQPEPAKAGVAKPVGSVAMHKNKPAFINLEASPERSTSFGWLTEAIKRSETQRRPVADHEGTAHFRITMRQDGGTVHLLDLSVAESSGYPQVDRAAADLIRRSFPIELKEPLAKSQVRIDLPITIHTN